MSLEEQQIDNNIITDIRGFVLSQELSLFQNSVLEIRL